MGRTRRRWVVSAIAGWFVFSIGRMRGCWEVHMKGIRATFGLKTAGRSPTGWGCARNIGLGSLWLVNTVSSPCRVMCEGISRGFIREVGL